MSLVALPNKVSSKISTSILYHNIFDYPLSSVELNTWYTPLKLKKKDSIYEKDGYYFLKNREKIIQKRLKKEKYSKEKLKIATKAAKFLKRIPWIRFVGVTGSLAMKNGGERDDIDLLIITKKQRLWTTRLIAFFWLQMGGFKVRKAGEREEKDKLCLNMWLDESDIGFNKKNIFTAHEIAQIIPLVNKDKTYERFIFENKWIFDYWPNAVKVKPKRVVLPQKGASVTLLRKVEELCFMLQLKHMQKKRTREVVTATRAFFHPFDWGSKVLNKLYA